jgi:hypothetical protein
MEPFPIRISRQTDEVAPHPDHRRIVPRHFRALFHAVPGASVPLTAELEIVVSPDGRKTTCISVHVWAAPAGADAAIPDTDPEAQRLDFANQAEDAEAGLTGDLMRLPVSRLKRAALDAAAVEAKLPERDYVAEDTRVPRKGGGLRRQRGPLTDEDLKRVAAAYGEAAKRRIPVKQNVAEALGVSESTAARYIREAKSREFITRAVRAGRPRRNRQR